MRRALFEELRAMPQRMVALPRDGADVAERLFDCNLISGVVDAAA